MAKFLQGLVAYATVWELEIQMMICGALGYVREEKHQELREGFGDVAKMLKAMINFLENKHSNP